MIPQGFVAPSQSRANSWVLPEAVHDKLLYVGGPYDGTVFVYSLPSFTLVGNLSTTAIGLAVDRRGDLYAVNYSANSVSVYHKGATSPYKTLADPNGYPGEVVVGRDNTVYVANIWGPKFIPGNVVEYAHGSTTPTAEISDPNFYSLDDVGLDSKNNLYVTYVNSGQAGQVNEYAPGQTVGTNLNIPLGYASGIDFDASDNIVVGDIGFSGRAAKVFSQKVHALLSEFDIGGDPADIAFTRYHSYVFVADYHAGQVIEYAYPSRVLAHVITSQNFLPSAVAVDPSDVR